MALGNSLVQINILRAKLDELSPLSPQTSNELWQKFRLEWNYNSNHIEGNTLTYGETLLLLIHGETTGDHKIREYDEMKAHDLAVHIIRDWAQDSDREISEAEIREINKIILKQPYWKEAITSDGQATRRLIKVGDYKEYPNSVRLSTGELFHYASPEETPRLMRELVEWYRNSEIKHPLVLASELHYRFIRIHPFDDGNGRIARLLVNYVLMKNGYPPIIIKSADKENYLAALRRADAGDLSVFTEYLAYQLIWSLEISQKASKGESIEEVDDLDKKISIWKRQLASGSTEAQPKSNNRLKELYDKYFSPLLNLFIRKMRTNFSDLFAEWEERSVINNTSNGLDKKALDEKFDSKFPMFEDPVIQDIVFDGGSINMIGLLIAMKGFKKDGVNAFSLNVEISIDFLPYMYVIKINGTQVREKLYGENILFHDQEVIITKAVEDVFKRVKANMKNPPLSEL
jgi:cell filamentation protein, protein adenylyltransferase